MAGNQITARIAGDIKLQFTEYAAEFGLSDSELAKLLLLRESRVMQLRAAVLSGQTVTNGRKAQSTKPQPSITAHYSSCAPVVRFDEYVKSFSSTLTRSDATAWLLERELTEKWLSVAFSLRPGVENE